MARKKPIGLHIRWMIRRDMPDVLSASATAHGDITEEDYLKWLRQRNCIGMVVEIDDKASKNHELVIGHMVYALETDSLQILRFVVHKKWRGRGAGRAMIEKLKGKLSHGRRVSVFADVPEDCLDMQLLLSRCGFRCTSVIDDAYRMVYALETDVDDDFELEIRRGIGVNRVAEYADGHDHGGES